MNERQLIATIRDKASFLCVGLDPDPDRMPPHLGTGPDAVLAFNKAIIDATADLAVAYKPNVAFYEALGPDGWDVLSDTLAAIPSDCLRIADAKRGDIGNTATRYARAAFEQWGADAVTVAPYMGRDSVEPFLAFEDKWTILLAATSNPGAADFEFHGAEGGQPLWRRVFEVSRTYEGAERLMYVVGATRPDWLAECRAAAPDRFLLVPGVGAQGGTLASVCDAGWAEDLAGGLLVNVGRSLLYASAETDFAAAARREALAIQQAMAVVLASDR
jgi:orotidine-5'-phosphate decarboxylase